MHCGTNAETARVEAPISNIPYTTATTATTCGNAKRTHACAEEKKPVSVGEKADRPCLRRVCGSTKKRTILCAVIARQQLANPPLHTEAAFPDGNSERGTSQFWHQIESLDVVWAILEKQQQL